MAGRGAHRLVPAWKEKHPNVENLPPQNYNPKPPQNYFAKPPHIERPTRSLNTKPPPNPPPQNVMSETQNPPCTIFLSALPKLRPENVMSEPQKLPPANVMSVPPLSSTSVNQMCTEAERRYLDAFYALIDERYRGLEPVQIDAVKPTVLSVVDTVNKPTTVPVQCTVIKPPVEINTVKKPVRPAVPVQINTFEEVSEPIEPSVDPNAKKKSKKAKKPTNRPIKTHGNYQPRYQPRSYCADGDSSDPLRHSVWVKNKGPVLIKQLPLKIMTV
eukprot:Platyproteum_vivax@DN6730_c0_g1_i2.p1